MVCFNNNIFVSQLYHHSDLKLFMDYMKGFRHLNLAIIRSTQKKQNIPDTKPTLSDASIGSLFFFSLFYIQKYRHHQHKKKK